MDDQLRYPFEEAITALADRQEQLADEAGLEDHSIDEKRLGDPNFMDVPHCIYFYYIRINSNGRLVVTHHFYPGGDPNDPSNPPNPTDWPAIDRNPILLTPILETLAKDARPSGAKIFPKIGENFLDIEWRRKAYIAFFIDEANWTLADQDGVFFIVEKKGGVAGTPNHSFFDSLRLDLTMPFGNSTDKRSALVFINHMKADDHGNDLKAGDPPQLYHFLISYDVAFEVGGTKMRVIFDPDGTNLGPPLPPP